jgi:hypothetical protein
MGSKHAFHQESRRTDQTEAAIAKFVSIHTGGDLPTTRTVDDVLKRLDYEELNEVLACIFETLRKSKFFSRYPRLIPAGLYHLAIDAVVTHKYTPDSAHDCANCPFCLKRQRGEETWYLHIYSVASIVCPGGIRIPLYVYPIHAKSLKCPETNSQENFKQECELAALPIILDKIRTRFPKLNLCILLDSLYANGPTMKLLNEARMEFLIVRKKGSMKTVGEDCDGLAQTAEHKVKGQLQERSKEGEKLVERSFQFFNDIEYQDLMISVLRFEERVCNSSGEEIFYVHWEWLASQRLTKKNAVSTASRGRMRWLEEDLFNSLKNRGFEIEHDYSRDSSAQVIWSILIMLAFLITELFTLMKQVKFIKGKRSLQAFMRSIFYELQYLCYQISVLPFLYKQRQIRYCLNISR